MRGETVFNTLLIFLGAGFGGVSRYWVSNGVYALLGRAFPFGTLIANSTGCFLMGLLYTLLLERFNGIGQELRPLILVGFLGGYTTFSSFSIETLNLYESGDWFGASLNILLSIIICIFLTWLGIVLGRQL